MTDISTSELMRDLILESIRIKSDRLNNIAIELLTRLGPSVVSRLILEATKPGNSPGHRVRALVAIGRGHLPLSPDHFLSVMALLNDNNEPVRRVAAEVIEANRRCQAGLKAEGKSVIEHFDNEIKIQ